VEGQLGAVCGLYCGACTIYRLTHDIDRKDKEVALKAMSERMKAPVEEIHCEGCLSDDVMFFCRRCEMKKCATSKPGVIRCSDCVDFPCEIITKFNNDGVAHHGECLKNVRRQKKIGIEEWLEEEYERVRCQYCGVSLDWYARVCHRCGVPNPKAITTVMGDSIQPHYRA
jgi:hypothetical protein